MTGKRRRGREAGGGGKDREKDQKLKKDICILCYKTKV